MIYSSINPVVLKKMSFIELYSYTGSTDYYEYMYNFIGDHLNYATSNGIVTAEREIPMDSHLLKYYRIILDCFL